MDDDLFEGKIVQPWKQLQQFVFDDLGVRFEFTVVISIFCFPLNYSPVRPALHQADK